METAINISGLSKTYQSAENKAVDALNLSISKGSFFGLLGPNGAGKTTTISIMCGLLNADGGRVEILGKKPKEVKSEIGVVPQDIALFEELTARENLRFFYDMYGIKNTKSSLLIDELLNRFSLEEKADKRVKTFSGGMKRRLNLIAGVMHSPKILFLDEPTVGIDVQSKNVIADFLKEINQEGMTIVYTSHMMEEAEKLCSHISVIDFGKQIIHGKPKELIQNNNCDNLEELFLKLTGRKVRD